MNQEEVIEYITNISNLLNGQLRGAINRKAREENLELIMITMADVFENAHNIAIQSEEDRLTLDKIKKLITDGETNHNDN